MAFQNSHAPYQCPQSYLDQYAEHQPHWNETGSRRCFNAMVTALDESVGRITSALKSSGLYENAILVYQLL